VRDILPSVLISHIRDHFFARVGQAQAGYRFSRADEDSLTGALGQSLLTVDPVVVDVAGRQYLWMTTYQKVRGRGMGAPEKEYGADGIFELQVTDSVKGVTRKKGLLFQAKKGWLGSDKELLKQTRNMRRFESDSIVIDYADGDYRAFDAGDVVMAEGVRARVPLSRRFQLAEVLADQFLECTRGVIDMIYDPRSEIVHVPGSAGTQAQDLARRVRAKDVVSTVVRRISF
jgi:hypothetical protein